MRALGEPERPVPKKPQPLDDARRSELARRIWREAKEPHGTIVQDYLFGRGWTGNMPWDQQESSQEDCVARNLVGLAIPASLRFHPALWYSPGVYLPSMVAAIEEADGDIVGVHRTFLKPDGSGKAEVKPNKKALGRERGCAVHLTVGAPELVLCEGIETGLSILQATGRHVWVALGTANLGQVRLPSFVRSVIIAADNDGSGLKAAREAVIAFSRQRRRVRIVVPKLPDFADELIA